MNLPAFAWALHVPRSRRALRAVGTASSWLRAPLRLQVHVIVLSCDLVGRTHLMTEDVALLLLLATSRAGRAGSSY
jgi:hypothetical protein